LSSICVTLSCARASDIAYFLEMSVYGRVVISVVIGLALSVISGATPNKVQTVEIDGKAKVHEKKSTEDLMRSEPTHTHHEKKSEATGHDKKSAEAGHEKKSAEAEHEKKSAETEHSLAKEVSGKATESHEKHDAQKAAAPAHKEASHAPEAKAEEQHKVADKMHSAHSSHENKHAPHRVFSDEEEDDAALDELEAMTIARTFEKKHTPPWGPPAAVPCTWNEWENDGTCAFTCGGRGKTGQKQSRSKNPARHDGTPCHGKTSEQIECAIEECPTTTTTTEEEATTTTAGGAPRMADLSSSALIASLVVALSWVGSSRH